MSLFLFCNLSIIVSLFTYRFGTHMSSDDKEYGNVSIVINLTGEMNKRLSRASERSQRSKTKEATLRLHDHLMNFDDIATLGKRFNVDGGEETV